MQAQPDSAYTLLASINTDTLNAESFAHWCMLKAELSHRTSHVSVPSIEDMEKLSIGTRKKVRKKNAWKPDSI